MTAPSTPPRPPSSTKSTVGIARQIRRQSVPYRGNPGAQQMLAFRVEVVDASGMQAGVLGVELRGHDIRGNVEDGDWVEITERLSRDGRIKSFMNLTTGQEVRRKIKIIS
jgi:hypothetical protein